MSDKTFAIGVIGSSEAVLAFKALGMRVVSAKDAKQAESAVFRLTQEGVPLIFITEDIARAIPETMQHYANDPAVSLIPLPGAHGTDGYGMERVRQNIEKAVGANILLNNTEE